MLPPVEGKDCDPAPFTLDRGRMVNLDYAIAAAKADGAWIECGVWKGESLRHIAKAATDKIIHGFDSFAGLPNSEGSTWGKGSFALKEEEKQALRWPQNVAVHEGWFTETLPKFVQDHYEVAFLHIDSDLYSSAVTVFEYLGRLLAKGAIIVFDEFRGYPGWEEGEAKAFGEWLAKSGRHARCISYSYMQATFILED